MALLGQTDAQGNRLYMRWPDTDDGTRYREYTGDDAPSPDLSFATDNSRIDRTLIIGGEAVTWKKAKSDFIGYAEVVTDGGVRYISRHLPHSFPHEDWLYCTSTPRFEQGGFKRTNLDVAEYGLMKMRAVYTALTFNVRSDSDVQNNIDGNHFQGKPDEGNALAGGWDDSRWVTKMVKPASKFYSIAKGAMQLVDADFTVIKAHPLLEGLPFGEPAAEVQYVWHGVPYNGVPWTLHLIAQGCLNDAAFDRFPAGTLRLEHIEPAARRDPLGNRVYDIVYKMTFLPRVGHKKGETSSSDTYHGHNWFRTADGNTRNFIVARATSTGTAAGDPPFRSLDFRLLFNPDQ